MNRNWIVWHSSGSGAEGWRLCAFPDDGFADGIGIYAAIQKQSRRARVAVAKQPEEKMLGTDVLVPEAIGFLSSVGKHAFGFIRKR